MSNKFAAILDDEDAALLKSLQRILGALKAESGGAEEPAEETPTTTRRRRAGADAGSSSTEPASDAGASAGRPRRSRSAEPAEEAPAEEAPVSRRRRSAEPEPTPPAEEPVRRSRRAAPAEDGISDADLTKAASQAAAKITPKVVMQILKEDYGVTTTNDVPKDKRQEFLDTLKYEMEEADKG